MQFNRSFLIVSLFCFFFVQAAPKGRRNRNWKDECSYDLFDLATKALNSARKGNQDEAMRLRMLFDSKFAQCINRQKRKDSQKHFFKNVKEGFFKGAILAGTGYILGRKNRKDSKKDDE